MNSNDTLHTMLDNARHERDLARAALHQAQSVAEHAQAQAEQLRQYRAEYAQRWTEQFRAASAIELVQCYQVFMQKLDQAIAHQQGLAHGAQRRTEAARDKLREHELQLASVGKLLERRQRERSKFAARADQRSTDEAAQRAALHGVRPIASAF